MSIHKGIWPSTKKSQIVANDIIYNVYGKEENDGFMQDFGFEDMKHDRG